MSVNRTRRQQTRPAKVDPSAVATLDTSTAEDETPARLAELTVLWPRLRYALARDGSGPSAEATSGPTGAKVGSPAVIDLDTEQAATSIERGIRDTAAEVVRLLNLEPPRRRVAQLQASLAVQQLERAQARAVALRIQSTCIHERRPPDVDEHQAARGAAVAIAAADNRITALRRRLTVLAHEQTTLGLLQVLPAWYAELRKRHQPLAGYLADDIARWHGDARSALNLRGRETQLGWQCPHHRDEPAQLRQHRDEAKLAPAVLAGRHPRSTAPLTWQLAESVYCPHCRKTWSGVAELHQLMKTIDQIEEDDEMRAEVIEIVRRMANAEQAAGRAPIGPFEADLLQAVGVDGLRCAQGCDCRRGTDDPRVDICDCNGECNGNAEDGTELLYEDAQRWLDFELALPERYRA